MRLMPSKTSNKQTADFDVSQLAESNAVVSDIAVDRARQAVRDRTTLHWVTGRHIKNWYLQRAVLAGYDRV